MKVATRNNLLKKLANSRWGTNARTIRTIALALCYSTAEYAAPVWERSAHAHLLNPELNQACRAITLCTLDIPLNSYLYVHWILDFKINIIIIKANKRSELVFARGNCPS